MTPFAIRGIDHIVLRVRDPEGSARFYREVLGCEVVKRQESLGLVHLDAGSALIDLLNAEAADGGTANVDHFCLRVEPFDEIAILAHLASHGIEAEPARQRFGAEGRGPSVYLPDPDGNVIELKGPPSA
ncbi:VOC family protein [Chromobacterium subtsugae]|uniref:VOC family protein n=1 Tax=Chromobacterium subtsugae TaxID=251747 RepID=A0ABS7FIV4_9NEIS|nr:MULTISPECIES: VOC family protein [Chromobacterium]KUM02079.1 lactoylglutathione lyase [Chromobacterium subtsugae]KZE86515.1 lactoylglutathione lyase [Chromobacterium sp. F49]MBW7568977.1 VOC family protein [Chromobacterium subtsugae]MBW8290010.1 VOC family protein [Chromobacterium subtsugae]WSE92979.1 VOC family protein [Chromobacterium subtsugae]